MKLTTGKTYWAKANEPPPRYPRLKQDVRCDVAIIGAGISGALLAHQLVKAGQQVVVIDKRPAGTGSTSASTALLLYETDTSLAEVARIHGKKSAFRVYALGRQAIREIAALARSIGGECGFEWRKTLYLASDAAGLVQLKEELRLRRQAGFTGALLNRRQLVRQFGLRFPGGLYAPGSAQVDAMALAQGLLARHVARRKLRVFQGTRVVRMKASADGVRLRTANRRTIEARHVIIATGYEAAPFLDADRVQLHSSYVIASQPQPAAALWPDRCLIWETARPYFYLRTTADGRILMGGEDEPFADPARRDAKLPAKTRKLARRFHQLFPKIPFDVEFAWTGTFGETRDGLPYIGAVQDSPRVLYALGYGGNGITFSQIAAKLLGRICQGRPAPDLRLFRLDRKESTGSRPKR